MLDVKARFGVATGRGFLAQHPFVLVLLLTLGFLATSGAILWKLRDQTWNAASRAADNLVATMAQDIGRNVEIFDLSLQAVIDGLKLSETSQVGPRARRAILFDRAATAQFLGSILVLDEHGDVVEDAGATPPRHANLRDRTYFTVHRADPGVGLYVSEPFRRRVTGSGDWVVAFSRRIDKPDGSFGGVVSGTLRLDYFRTMFSRLKLGPQSTVTLFRTDGTLLVRWPFDDAIVGRNLMGTGVMRGLLAVQSGQFTAKASLDGVRRAITFAHVTGLPLIICVAQSPSDVLASWYRWTAAIAGVLAVMGLATAGLAKVAQTEFRRRSTAEAELRRHAAQLELISEHATDMIVRLDASLIRRYVSPSSMNLFGHPPEEMVGQNIRDTMHVADRAQALRMIEDARRQQSHASVTYRIRRADGRLAWVESQFSFMPSDGGFTVLVRDVTQRKAVECELAEAHEKLRRLANTDVLTGLANRRRFDDALRKEWRRAAREERPLALMLLDVDHFKQFNDRYGHQEGDACLHAVACALADRVRRPADVIARYGGEEFVLLLPDMEIPAAAAFAEDLRKAVQELAIPHAANSTHGRVVTVSIGYGMAMPGSQSSDQDAATGMRALMSLCDSALYEAKHAGRNRTMVGANLRARQEEDLPTLAV